MNDLDDGEFYYRLSVWMFTRVITDKTIKNPTTENNDVWVVKAKGKSEICFALHSASSSQC